MLFESLPPDPLFAPWMLLAVHGGFLLASTATALWLARRFQLGRVYALTSVGFLWVMALWMFGILPMWLGVMVAAAMIATGFIWDRRMFASRSREPEQDV